MNTEELIAESHRILELANYRTRTVGAEQYAANDEDRHRFIDMEPRDLLDYCKEETLDFINYGVMLTILLERTGNHLRDFEIKAKSEMGRQTEELRVLELKRNTAAGNVTSLERRQSGLQEQNNRIQKAIDDGERLAGELADQLSGTQNAIERAREEHGEAVRKNDWLKMEVERLEGRRATAAADIDNLQVVQEKLCQEIKKLQEFNGQAGAERETRIQAAAELESQIRELRHQLSMLKEEARELAEDNDGKRIRAEPSTPGFRPMELACWGCKDPAGSMAGPLLIMDDGHVWHKPCFDWAQGNLSEPALKRAEEQKAKAAPDVPVLRALERAEKSAASFIEAMNDARAAIGGS